MTLPYPRRAFDNAQAVRRSLRPVLDADKLTSIGITIGLHLLIAAAALTVVQVARPRVMQELSVRITPEKIKPAQDAAPPLKLTVPTAVTMPPPEVVIQTVTPPPMAVQTAAKPVPPMPMVSHAAAVGEARDSFLGRLLAQLGRFKQYPRAARQAHIEGVVMLHFVMDAQGRVQSFEIAKSSGRPVLDAEALALIQRAQPLPALPADYPTRTLDAVVPIEFSLNG
jgi:protein TonB